MLRFGQRFSQSIFQLENEYYHHYQELAIEAEWAPSGMQQGWRYGKKEKDLRYIVFSRSGRFDMAGGRDWLYVETDQPHSTRVMEFF